MKPLLALTLCCFLMGCAEESKLTPVKATTEKAAAHDHSSAAQHGGTIVEVGSHAALMEVAHDEAAGVVTVWIYDMAGAALAADEAPVLNVSGDDPKQLTGTDEGGAWVFRDEALATHVHGARFRVSIGGESYSPDMPDAH